MSFRPDSPVCLAQATVDLWHKSLVSLFELAQETTGLNKYQVCYLVIEHFKHYWPNYSTDHIFWIQVMFINNVEPPAPLAGWWIHEFREATPLIDAVSAVLRSPSSSKLRCKL